MLALPALVCIEDPDALLAAIQRWALESRHHWEQPGVDLPAHSCFPEVMDPDNLPAGVQRRVISGVEMWVRERTFSARECRGLLANAFLGNLHDPMKPRKDAFNSGGLDFHRMYQLFTLEGGVPVGLQKIAASGAHE